MRLIRLLAVTLGCLVALGAQVLSAETYGEAFPGHLDYLDADMASRFGAIVMQRGSLPIGKGVADLVVQDGYYALGAADARWVLEDLWGNLPGPETQALIFQDGMTPLDGAWAAIVTYSASGHISDIEADTLDYNEIFQSFRDGDAAANEERAKLGLLALTTDRLSGQPGYDRASRSLRFSLILREAGTVDDILNARAWVLGRHGHVEMNFIGRGDQAGEVDAAMPKVTAMVRFAEGNRYEDYIPGVDALSEGGLEGLLGGGAAQAGLLVVLLAFFKKGGVYLLLIPAAWAWTRFKGLLRGPGGDPK